MKTLLTMEYYNEHGLAHRTTDNNTSRNHRGIISSLGSLLGL